MATIFIRELWIYPIKSLGGVRVEAAPITSAGSLVLDREWIVVDSGNNMVWQGDIPRMTLVTLSLGAALAYFEELNAVLDFGAARLALRDPCVRCELPNISLVDASRGKQPLRLIGRLSMGRPGARPGSFGTYCRAEGKALRTGMQATIQ